MVISGVYGGQINNRRRVNMEVFDPFGMEALIFTGHRRLFAIGFCLWFSSTLGEEVSEPACMP